jgi:hypothetical protein
MAVPVVSEPVPAVVGTRVELEKEWALEREIARLR